MSKFKCSDFYFLWELQIHTGNSGLFQCFCFLDLLLNLTLPFVSESCSSIIKTFRSESLVNRELLRWQSSWHCNIRALASPWWSPRLLVAIMIATLRTEWAGMMCSQHVCSVREACHHFQSVTQIGRGRRQDEESQVKTEGFWVSNLVAVIEKMTASLDIECEENHHVFQPWKSDICVYTVCNETLYRIIDKCFLLNAPRRQY